MPEPSDSWAPQRGEAEDCYVCGKRRPISALAYKSFPDGDAGYVCLDCDASGY